MEEIVRIEKIVQSFRTGFWLKKNEVLHQVSFDIPKQTIFGLLGPNGAGKTTLIHLLTGIRKPKSGRIEVSGYAAGTWQAKSQIGYLPERPYFYEHLTGVQILTYLGTLSGMSHKQLKSKIEEVLSVVSLEHAGNIELKNYSKGMLQRIGIAQAIIHDPQILILDEPMSGLDPVGRREIRELILNLYERGKTILMSSHIIPDIELICKKVAVLQKGHLIRCAPLSDILSGGEGMYEIEIEDDKKEKKLDEKYGFHEIPSGYRIEVEKNKKDDLVRELLNQNISIDRLSVLRNNKLESLFKKEEVYEN
ncbi:MAG: multidrug ABC transporter ATP-binding protein [Bdellovibrionaceae bacterium]|nr:multidrug ABC transporter ATP-binding protein [Pseudobdellovibrionaceae bacterium]|tara:strand:+ start:550 stop:1470 length:921 start_codon:yes stop_codon:yes gene_type:complete